ncbi:hypothetical protein PHAVU_003G217400 [Phaseolus vulgaris]|uniref:Uncharacterized protein n=1 Tax=Phaseolus vulgaris TaxID=3885 RepID=V7CFD6_PHAVU|nr:hypothetical protein PHAVU_003G217400g [Phaseolus vulgaris]XP_007155623.1 hypothetical protein PHAVU_003G217400g [Phaseolus vulgaris]ESW27616.1 hypothetical protein PHAVU_003G217400g [Phaseolus vulgaris]ESW27617.1 hypothetical protein PHAVU_003G217400g [Phaseolus vulgaris]
MQMQQLPNPPPPLYILQKHHFLPLLPHSLPSSPLFSLPFKLFNPFICFFFTFFNSFICFLLSNMLLELSMKLVEAEPREYPRVGSTNCVLKIQEKTMSPHRA